ncbi:hypothetical protein [Cerasicoccus arenae]|nr:hypothetical protein [Cerasicoccus arenae]MBK1857259.1 hypothetical protein [Cerasicoccus arenae]
MSNSDESWGFVSSMLNIVLESQFTVGEQVFISLADFYMNLLHGWNDF